ncbi:MAG: hypothetical protein ACM3KR_01825 [Deltaproteobacteria bacterium]
MKLTDYLSNEKGGTFILILMTFLPVLILVTYLGCQFRNASNTFMETRNDIQAYYAAEMGIERYKNQVIGNHAYSDAMSFSKTIGAVTYNVQVSSARIGSGVDEKVKITSTISGSNISTERIITLSRF